MFHLTTGKILALSSLAVLLLIFSLFGFDYLESRFALDMAQRINSHVVPNVRALERMRFGIVRVVSSTSEYLLLELARATEPENEASDGELGQEGEKTLIREGVETFEKGLATYREIGHTGDKEDVAAPIVAAFEQVKEMAWHMVGLDARASPSTIFRLKEDFEARERLALALVNTALERELAETGRILGETRSTISHMRFIAALIAGIASLVVILYALGVYRLTMRETEARARAEETNASLAREVEFRKRVEAQLAAAQKLKAMGTLLGGMAHSVNNYLVPVISLTRMTQEELPPGSAAAEDLQRVLKAAQSASALLQEVLSFARPKGECPAGRRGTELNPCLSHAAKMVAAALPSAIDLHYAPAAQGTCVSVTCEEVETLLLNLTSNAVDAIGDQAGSIDVEVGLVDVDSPPPEGTPPNLAAGRYARISVTDSGDGIPEDILPNLFDPFFTTKEVGKGAGLGLSVTYGIVDRADGGIVVEGRPGEGARFHVFLPTGKIID